MFTFSKHVQGYSVQCLFLKSRVQQFDGDRNSFLCLSLWCSVGGSVCY